MNRRMTERCPWLVSAVVAMALVAAAGGALAQTGPLGETIQPGDVLQMVVPGRPDLDSALVVDQNGTVDIPQVGEVRLNGLSLGEAGVLLKQRLRLIAPTLDMVELSRAGAASSRVYVLGQVGNPGVHDFTRQPTVWDVLRAAGGPLATANLREARVIREENGQPGSVPLDLSKMLDGEDFPTIALRDGDTLVIPALAVGVSGVAAERGVKVFGGVVVPSVVQVDGPTLLMDVLMLAGSPTPDANTKKIWWVHAVDGVDQAQVVNLRRFLEKGDPEGNPLIYPGDTVNVTISRPGRFSVLLSATTVLSAIYVAITR
jgi:polysaccharide export outer membrane protein